MRKAILTTLAASAAVLGMVFVTLPAQATIPHPSWGQCSNMDGWFVNDDEDGDSTPDSDTVDRRPTATAAGLEFTGADLIHHNVTGVTTDTLTPGTYLLASGSSAPNQPSFFSVEVYEGPGTYGTLRWNPSNSKWSMVANGGTFYEGSNATDVVTAAGKGKTVVRFGVGYTLNPPGTETVVVEKVHFEGIDYDLTCALPAPTTPPATPTTEPTPEPTASATPSATVSVTPTPSASTPGQGGGGSPEPTDGTTTEPVPVPTESQASNPPALALTGGKGRPELVLILIGFALLCAGGVLYGVTRIRRTRAQY